MRCFLIFKLLILFVIQVNSQNDFIVKTDLLVIPASLINNSINGSVTFEKGLKRNYSLNLRIAYGLRENIRTKDMLNSKVFNITLYFKKYFSKDDFLKRWYWGIYLKNDLRIKQVSLLNQSLATGSNLNVYRYNYSGIGVLFGYQILTKKGFCLDTNLGIGGLYLSNFKQTTNSLQPENPNKVIGDVLIMLNIGYDISNLFKSKNSKESKTN